MKLKFGILGYGFMGHVHADTVKKLDGVELIALCDNDPEKFEDAPADVIKYSSIDDLLANKDINTVIISLPNTLHKEATIKAARAGKNILCEKPVALSLEDFDEMIKVVKECGVKFAVHQQRRWDKDFRIAKEVYDSKTLGKVYTIQSKIFGFNGNMHDWHVYKEMGGGMLYDWGVHIIDQMLWMVDSKVKSVFADIRNVINKEVDDYFKIILRFENGVIGEIELGTYFLKDDPTWFTHHWFIGGDKGTMYVDNFNAPKGKIVRTTRLLQNVPGKVTMTASGPTRSFGTPPPDLIVTEELPEVKADHVMYFDNFIKACNGEEEFIVKPEENRRVLALMNAVWKSSETGKSIDFE